MSAETTQTDTELAHSPETPGAWGGMPVAALLIGGLLGGTAIAWAVSRAREKPVEQRTRDRLAARGPAAVVPSAADIHVG